ncbi:carbohydrate ABC transporter substrate-binding protein (CUT1 family) [Saccharothrix saharensis]|uniref:Carbohydrate ABC transporter substrate-binding protein (CUT1 family) n=1 Tax=Saccharothrix saharensis TaxID=571190 RepID=A0A543JQ91_9PSEU|nr:extracellular solute-binding protein [Saccharothrix saharensis]TQM85009.1 carbohydrate ABC transporter substrate-binding protein (CUT1 family) [Saccharothrix saharensis]
MQRSRYSRRAVLAASVAALSLVATACGSDEPADAGGPVTLTMSAWSMKTTPEFAELAEAFQARNPEVKIEFKEYDATNYDTQLTADLAAGSAPDLYVLKNLKNFITYQAGEQLLDVSDVAGGLGDEVNGLGNYKVDGVTYAVPYRQDSWYLYYNKDLFTAAGVTPPSGAWTWAEYEKAVADLAAGLKAAGSPAKAAYQHVWQSTVQGLALAQTPGADLGSGDYGYLAPYYERALAQQKAGVQVDFGTATTTTLQYQAQFGTQQAATMLMGSWYVATLVAQQKKGDAQAFQWGFAPAPQRDASGKDKPVTFGDPTGLGVNAAIDEGKTAAAKEFLAFVAGEDGAKALASIGITPATLTEPVVQAYFGVDGVPGDELSRFSFATHDTRAENPVSPQTAALQNILQETHSAIMSESTPVGEALAKAGERARSEVLESR